MESKFKLDDAAKSKLLKSGICSLDIEYDPNYDYHDKEFPDNFWGTGLSYYVGEEIEAFWIRDRETIQELLDFLTENNIIITGHYFQTDVVGFLAAGYTFKKDPIIYDTTVAFNFLEEEVKDNKIGLKVLSEELLNKPRTTFEENVIYGPDSPQFTAYAIEDVVDQLRLMKMFEIKLKEYDLWDPYLTITASIFPFAHMAYEGMPFDPDVAEDLYYKYVTLEGELEQNIYQHIGKINLDSPVQLSKRLFKELKYYVPGLKKTGSDTIATNYENIEKLAEKYPVCELLSAKRTCSKAINTYIEGFVDMYQRYGRIYDMHMLHSATGRTRTKVLQLIPKDPGENIIHNAQLKAALSDLKLRKVFNAGPGKVLISADLSSAEYRYAAVVSGDQKMIAMYKHYECKSCGNQGSSEYVVRVCPKCGCSDSNFTQGKDLHAFMRDIANENGANINRNQAKGVSFCIIFNGTPNKLMTILNLPYDNCKKIHGVLLKEFKGINDWHERIRRIVRNPKPYVDLYGNYIPKACEFRDLFGRRRWINMSKRLAAANGNTDWAYKSADNQLINFGCQAPTCTHVQIALRNTRKRLISEGLWGPAKIINMVHDQIDMECDEDIATDVAGILRYEMENAVHIGVPTPSDCSIAKNYLDCK